MIVAVNGVELHVEDIGHGKPLLLLHAFPLSGAMWQPQREALQNRYRLIIPDQRGFGGSPLPGAYTLDDIAADMLALLDQLGLERVPVCGLSMGGYVAFALYRLAPHRFSALILADTRAQDDTPAARERRVAGARLAREQGAAAVAAQALPGMVANPTAPALDTMRRIVEATNPEAIACAQEAMAARPDSRSLLEQIIVPTLVLVGSEDALTPPDEVRAMAAAIPGAKLVELAGAGHVSNLEQPTHFTAELEAFLA